MSKILVVDNDKNTVETIKAALATDKNYHVDAVYSGKEALEKMKKNRQYDLLLLDVMMPKMSGIDVCRTMVIDKRLKNIPVVLVSALPVSSPAFQESQEKFDELSVVKDVLEKPFAIGDLLRIVKKLTVAVN